MPFGILDVKGVEHVPGTTQYFDDPSRPQLATSDHVGLKCDTSGKQPIILIPQPSDDPNDPLNWPLWRRDLITFTLCFAGILATALGPILAANTITISLLFSRDFTQVALLTGYFLLGAGAGAIFFVPSGRIWGKRHLFLLGICIIIASSAWAGKVGTDYGSFIGARVVQGVGCAPFESLLNAAVGDLYFVHQRGVRMAFTNLAIFGGAFFTPILVGKITESLGWNWTFFFVSIFLAPTLLAVFFFCPETTYRRAAILNTDTTVAEESKQESSPRHPDSSSPERSSEPSRGFVLFPTSSALQPIGNANTPKKSFVESLSLFDGRKTDERYWVLLLRPFPLLTHPAFIWGCLIQGTMIGWTVFIGVIVAAIFIGPPYYWGEVMAGYTYTGAFVGALCGFAIAGLLADSSVKYLTRLNKGIYEPEFRILMVFPMMIIGGIGLYGFGLTAGEVISGKFTYHVPLVFFGFEVAGMVIGAVASSLYIVDAYRDLTIEGFTIMIIFKNFFSFVLTFYAYDWIIQGGIRPTLLAIASIQVAVCLLSVPMYIYGKRVRAFYHRHDLLALTHLR
ncbi:major facilitator superfamily domain-containing protein [Ilyonectria robusta]|uniref:major facilitator superfamily domain-containing protein n=1 Tax=Ilyonectria robusta TaxID=1079257 RepID=UPI001E8EBC3C|nr:major facilitator superfamily domain-containing protein [Ilyonectria robusta]KAH8737378.1 major facilitator superfamily domain-containing protein [Ilyonectria robusta]